METGGQLDQRLITPSTEFSSTIEIMSAPSPAASTREDRETRGASGRYRGRIITVCRFACCENVKLKLMKILHCFCENIISKKESFFY